MASRSLDIIINGKNRSNEAFRKAEGNIARLNDRLRTAAAAIAGFVGARAITRFATESIKLFGRQEQAVNKLRAALRLLGPEAEAQLADMQRFASGIQAVTTEGDEAVLELASLGASLGKLEGEQLKEATRAAIGLSRALGTNTVSAMRLVARAAIGDTSQLTRYGIKLDETLSDQEKFNQLLKIGASNFDLATAEAKTLTGQITQLSNRWGDLRENFGKALLVNGQPLLRWLEEVVTRVEDINRGTTLEAGDVLARGGDRLKTLAAELAKAQESLRLATNPTLGERLGSGKHIAALRIAGVDQIRRRIAAIQAEIRSLSSLDAVDDKITSDLKEQARLAEERAKALEKFKPKSGPDPLFGQFAQLKEIFDRLAPFSERVKEMIKTPVDKLREDMMLLRDAVKVGLLTRDQAQRAADAFGQRFREQVGEESDNDTGGPSSMSRLPGLLEERLTTGLQSRDRESQAVEYARRSAEAAAKTERHAKSQDEKLGAIVQQVQSLIFQAETLGT